VLNYRSLQKDSGLYLQEIEGHKPLISLNYKSKYLMFRNYNYYKRTEQNWKSKSTLLCLVLL